jgi:hypothetical protein
MASSSAAAAAVAERDLLDDWTRDAVKDKAEFGFTPFKLDISNALGLDTKRARAVLKNYALNNPTGYSAMRDRIYVQIVQSMVESAHQNIWNLLAKGKTPDGDQMRVDGVPWSPNLPNQEIGKLANGFAESMMEAFSDMMDKIFPDNYDKLADDKSMHIAKVKGITSSAAPSASE